MSRKVLKLIAHAKVYSQLIGMGCLYFLVMGTILCFVFANSEGSMTQALSPLSWSVVALKVLIADALVYALGMAIHLWLCWRTMPMTRQCNLIILGGGGD